ncbi:MAG: amidase [Candidatus Solibacter usitatus]|nr:amidase [Candidatus Solibacter usitatus]
MDRRQWVQLLAVLTAARRGRAAAKFTREELAAGLKLMGLEFGGAQMDMMLAGVNRAADDYERLRGIDIPLDTEPAFSFHPGLAGRQPNAGPARFKPSVVRAPKKKTWASVEELAFLPVTQLAPLVRARLVTSTELTRMYLERLKRYGPKLLCVVTLTEELALEQARAADAEIAAGKCRGPLHGIPYGLKDLFATKGIKTTWGAEPFREQVIDSDSTVYTRLREAGGVLVAKLSTGALAMGGMWFGGMTKTPWNMEQTSSGSSAGPASATSAGLVGYAIGTETRGSIVSPAIRCGTVGLRPTYGRVPRSGAMGLSWTMDKVGPLCRAVEDCALVLNAIHGPDGHDRTVTGAPLNWEPARPLAGLRIGVAQKAFDQASGEMKEVQLKALEDLKRAGAVMKPVEMPDATAGTLGFILSAEAAAAFDDITRDGRVGQLRDQAANAWPNSFRTSRLIPAVEYIRAQRARTLLMEKMEKFFEEWDVVVCPPYAHLSSTNLTGHPQVVVPCGFVKGMPAGLSFIGRLWEEGLPLRVALAYEQATEWHSKRPPLS